MSLLGLKGTHKLLFCVLFAKLLQHMPSHKVKLLGRDEGLSIVLFCRHLLLDFYSIFAALHLASALRQWSEHHSIIISLFRCFKYVWSTITVVIKNNGRKTTMFRKYNNQNVDKVFEKSNFIAVIKICHFAYSMGNINKSVSQKINKTHPVCVCLKPEGTFFMPQDLKEI